MRILIKNKKGLFSQFFKETNLTREKLALKLGVNYWNLRHWLEDRNMPKEVFLNLIKFYPKIKILAHYSELPDNWGCAKGGKNSFKKKSKKEIFTLVQKMWKARKIKIKIKAPSLNEDFCELYGIMLGDGCLSRFRGGKGRRIRHGLFITGNSKTDILYYKYYLIPLFNKLFNISPSIYTYTTFNGIKIDVRNKSLVKIFLKLGFPLGRKGEIFIPNKIVKLGYKHVNKVIRGLFDTDGCFFARKDEGYKYPYIAITNNSKILHEQLKKILRKQGLPAYIHANNTVIRGIKNTYHWFNLIGSSHPLTLERYNKWKVTKKLLPKGLIDQR